MITTTPIKVRHNLIDYLKLKKNRTTISNKEKQPEKGKQIDDPNGQKPSLSAFFWFCNEERHEVIKLNPEYGVGDITKDLERKWSVVDAETKYKYEVLTEKYKAS